MKKPSSVKTTFTVYTIGKVLGEGGSGIVYEAFDDEGSKFAIKALDPAKASREKIKRFKNEFAFCSKNKHANIITVLDHGLINDDIPFVVMPLYDNSLRKLIGNLNAKHAVNIFCKIMDGVEAAHKLGVVHRDIKPENILIRNNENDIVIADFGIAEFQEEELYTVIETKEGTRLANFKYAAPEQRTQGRRIDHRADIYSLGLILNELITSEIPFGTNFIKISDAAKDYSYLDAIVEKMLHQNPSSRFNSISEIKQELIMRGEEHIIFQKLNKLEKTVVPATEVDDPLVLDPMRIISVDWDEDTLIIELNQNVNADWESAFRNMGDYNYILGKDPHNFRLRENKASINAMAHEAQMIVDYFKQWLPIANQKYKAKLEQEIKEEARKQREEIRRRVQKEKQRSVVLSNIKF